MKKMLPVFAVLLLLIGCNSTPKTTEEKPAAAAPTETKPAFTPYKGRLVQLTVTDFDKWYAGFQSHDSLFKSYGLTGHGVARLLDNDKEVIVFSDVADVTKATAYDNAPERKANMKAGGVTKASNPTYWDIIMDDTSKIPQHERLMVVHHVKDFDAWKKVFDAEGKDARAANGMIDRLMARNVSDPNTIALLFAITDMDKAKARTNSPEMKKTMTDAGVDAAPQITWFKWVNH